MLPAPQNALLQYVLDAVPQPAVPPPAAVAALGSAAAASGSRYSKAQALGPHCGDGVCQAGETCATCAYDCKQVPAGPTARRTCRTVVANAVLQKSRASPLIQQQTFCIHTYAHRPEHHQDALVSARAHATLGLTVHRSSCRLSPISPLCRAPQADGVTPCQRVGILYSPWHWPAYTAQQIIEAKGGTPLNMEMILSSRLELGMPAVRASSPCVHAASQLHV